MTVRGADRHAPIGVRPGQAAHPDRVPQRPTWRRQEVRHACGLHVRQFTELGQQLRLQQSHAISILGPGRGHMERHHAARIEAAVHDGEVVVAAEQQRGGAHERHAQCDLCEDEPLLEPVAASGHASRSGRHHLLQVAPRSHDSGDDADNDGRDKRRHRRERQRAPVERELVQAWSGGQDRRHQANEANRQRRPETCAEGADDQPFPPDHGDGATSRRAERRADGEVAGTPAHLHQCEAGNVGHRDQPQRANRCKDEDESAPRGANPCLLERADFSRPAGVGLRKLPGQALPARWRGRERPARSSRLASAVRRH